MTPEEAIRKFVSLKSQMKDLEGQLDELIPVIDKAAEFKPGSKTGHIVAAGVKMTVTHRESEKWDQAELAKAKAWVNDDAKFNNYFKTEFLPKSAAAVREMTADPKFSVVVQGCRKVTIGKPGLSWEPIEAEA